MLHPLRHQLNPMRIVLASGSPRRQELIQNLVSLGTFFEKSNFNYIFVPRVFSK